MPKHAEAMAKAVVRVYATVQEKGLVARVPEKEVCAAVARVRDRAA
jgi:hypothetical protein